MKIFGYLDDILRVYYHLFDFIGNRTTHMIVSGIGILVILWILSKFVPRRS